MPQNQSNRGAFCRQRRCSVPAKCRWDNCRSPSRLLQERPGWQADGAATQGPSPKEPLLTRRVLHRDALHAELLGEEEDGTNTGEVITHVLTRKTLEEFSLTRVCLKINLVFDDN